MPTSPSRSTPPPTCRARWGRNAAGTASLTFQQPFRVAMHASRLLTEERRMTDLAAIAAARARGQAAEAEALALADRLVAAKADRARCAPTSPRCPAASPRCSRPSPRRRRAWPRRPARATRWPRRRAPPRPRADAAEAAAQAAADAATEAHAGPARHRCRRTAGIRRSALIARGAEAAVRRRARGGHGRQSRSGGAQRGQRAARAAAPRPTPSCRPRRPSWPPRRRSSPTANAQLDRRAQPVRPRSRRCPAS